MSTTNPSAHYFESVAGQWDTLRSGYFTPAVREAAIAKAYLRPEMVVADVGAGTGFMAAGLAPLVKRVYAFDGASAMLEVAQANLAGFENIIYQPADGLALPLPDDSLDAVFANMYLHHCPDPLAAIREMVRVLRPGGRLVLTDLDAHPFAWLKEEMADVWQGFERDQVRAWFQQAGLVNRIVDCTGTNCCAPSQTQETTPGSAVEISVFVAAGTKPVDGIEAAIRQDYTAHATGHTQGTPTGWVAGCACAPGGEAQESACCQPAEESVEMSSCCGPAEISCGCGSASLDEAAFPLSYSEAERGEIPSEAAEISLGCGNSIAIAGLQPGEVVLDIGSGGGIDAFLSANRGGAAGQVIGVDMTPALIERARRAAERQGYRQVEFRLGQAELLPVEDASVDVVISNCVINLTRDKGRVFAEAFRVLKAGGRLEVSDVVTDTGLPGDLREDPHSWAGCVSGALPESEYTDLIRQAGFTDLSVRRSAVTGAAGGAHFYSAIVSARKEG